MSGRICFFILLLISLTGIYAQAQSPVVQVDLNMHGRSEREVTEPGYTPWNLQGEHTGSVTLSGVTFTLTAILSDDTPVFQAGWAKDLVQSPYFMRLAGDGIKVDHGTYIEMRISGLPEGKHTLQTYHNIWDDTLKTAYCPIDVTLNGRAVHRHIRRSAKVRNGMEATRLLTEMEVSGPGQEVVLAFRPVMGDFARPSGKFANFSVCLNGFELNTEDASKQAHSPVPGDREFHADADDGTFLLHWQPAIAGNVAGHTLYMGTDSAAVARARESDKSICIGTLPAETQQYLAKGLYSMETYYWRVDQTDSDGTVTKGKTWSFRPRQTAFPGAEGYGRFATGGRGGKVVYVTNLNDSGPGSFREAVTNGTGPRTVLFHVSGMIELESRIIMNPGITVAGQTAPGKGICFRGAPIGINSETVCRFIRMRLGAGRTYDGLGMAGANHSILDHCSISWTIDEAFSSRGGKNITLQRNLISEALNVAGHQKYAFGNQHGYAGTISGNIGSYHHNLLAHCAGRNFSMGDAIDGKGSWVSRLDIFNNVVYNYGHRANDGEVHQVNFHNNYYKKGPGTSIDYIFTLDIKGYGSGTEQAYYAGNIISEPGGKYLNDGTDRQYGRRIALEKNYPMPDYELFPDAPFFDSQATVHTARDAYKIVLSDAGCNLPVSDEHDRRIVRETLQGTYTYVGSVSGKKGLIDHQDDAGGYEEYPAESRPAGFDTDMDGLPDWWEKWHGTDPGSPAGDFSDANADPDRDGYTNLEDYLYWMSVPHYEIEANLPYTIDLTPLTAGFTQNPVYSTVSGGDLEITYDGSLMTLTLKRNRKGIHYVNFKVTDAEGSEMIRTLGIRAKE